MISLSVLFWIFVIIFAFIGILRGWVRELLVTLSGVFALLMLAIIERFIPTITGDMSTTNLFWFRTGILLACIVFGYLSPKLPRLAMNIKISYESLQNSILGLIVGGMNAYLIIGSIWHFLIKAGYPFSDSIKAPDASTAIGQKSAWLIAHLPPTWLDIPLVYIAAAVMAILVIMVLR